MMSDTDLPLFNGDDARARRDDPETSHIAARKLNESGRIGTLQRKIYIAVLNRDGLTACEYERITGIKAHKILPVLRKKGLIYNGVTRACRATGQLAMTWWLRK